MIRTVLLASCALMLGTVPALAQFDENGCVVDYQEGVDYFADKAEIAHARNFSVSYHNSYKLLTVEKPVPGGAPETYLLVQCGTPVPTLSQKIDDTIELPVSTLFAGSTTQNPSLLALGRVETITGIARKDFVALPEVMEHVNRPEVVEFEPNNMIDAERIVAAAPDVVMAAGSGSAELVQVRNLGIPVVNHADWQETTPLGRAEWIKFISLFFNDEAAANSTYADIEGEYRAAVDLIAGLPEEDRPLVLSGSAFEGTFFAAGGQSFVAESIRDAGGRYVFNDDPNTGSFQIHDFERLIVSALDAQFWIHASNDYQTLADIAADDPRLASLPAAQAGQVWMPDALKGPNGGMQIYEMGTLRPDIVIKDLISVFHPDLAGDHERVFYRSISLND